MLRLYNGLLLPLRALVEGWALWQTHRHPQRAVEWAERRGRSRPLVPAAGIWLHGASVGEARIVSALVDRLRERIPGRGLVASSVTRAGRAALPEPPLVDGAFFAPLDFPDIVRRTMDAIRPAVLALVETELWPNLLRTAAQRRLPTAVLNGRISRERMGHYRRLGRLYRPLLAGLELVCAQSESDAQRFAELGVGDRALHVTGNIKYDLPTPESNPASLRQHLGLPADRPVWVAGSTRDGEEALILDAFRQVRQSRPRLLLVLAPRHLDRLAQVERLISVAGLRRQRLSDVAAGIHPEYDLLLVDTIGALAGLYCLATVAFVGGSLVPIGGHNVLEPAVFGVPVLYGPHTGHVREPVEALEAAGGGQRVDDSGQLAGAVRGLLDDGERRERMGHHAAAVVKRNRGALERGVALLVALVEQAGRST